MIASQGHSLTPSICSSLFSKFPLSLYFIVLVMRLIVLIWSYSSTFVFFPSKCIDVWCVHVHGTHYPKFRLFSTRYVWYSRAIWCITLFNILIMDEGHVLYIFCNRFMLLVCTTLLTHGVVFVGGLTVQLCVLMLLSVGHICLLLFLCHDQCIDFVWTLWFGWWG